MKLVKCFDVHRRLKNAIFFPDYRDTFISALFITTLLLSLFVVTYVKAVETHIRAIKLRLILKSLNKVCNDRRCIGEIFVINDNPLSCRQIGFSEKRGPK